MLSLIYLQLQTFGYDCSRRKVKHSYGNMAAPAWRRRTLLLRGDGRTGGRQGEREIGNVMYMYCWSLG